LDRIFYGNPVAPFPANALAVLLALASAVGYGLGLTLTQLGLRHVPPATGAAISIPASALLFVAAAPIGLAGATPVWSALPIFAAVGLLFPAAATLLTFAANRRLGPVITGSLGNLAPVFAVVLAFVLLGEPLRLGQMLGLAIILAGVLALTGPPGRAKAGWASWYVALPLVTAALRGCIQPVIKLGLAVWPSPFAAVLTGYLVSAAVVVTALRLRTGRWRPQANARGLAWFAGVGICNGLAVLLMYAALARGPVTIVSPLVATYPLVTVAASALARHAVDNQLRVTLGAALTVAGVGLLLVS
jgi:drug/metabolite transporter (DMT)-like permease